MTALARIGRLFPPNPTSEVVETSIDLPAAPEAVWEKMMFYEEVPQRPTPLLRLFLPLPVRTQGDKTRVGAAIACVYEDGYLEKRITAVEPARTVKFDVVVQGLGIEDCISMDGGYYELSPSTVGTRVVLATIYRGHLRPRWLWRPFEHHLAHRLHTHILDGMRLAVDDGARPASTGALPPLETVGAVPAAQALGTRHALVADVARR